MTTYIIEGLDRLGKSTLIKGLKNTLGYHMEFHRQKPELLDRYFEDATDHLELNGNVALYSESKRIALKRYQEECFSLDMELIAHSHMVVGDSGTPLSIIFDRSWLGESVYAPLYRGYSGDYVFELEEKHNIANTNTVLVLLIEDFANSKHFVDDGESFDITKRADEQDMFVRAFNKSLIPRKIAICVTDEKTGQFRDKDEILDLVLRAKW